MSDGTSSPPELVRQALRRLADEGYVKVGTFERDVRIVWTWLTHIAWLARVEENPGNV